MKYVFGYFVSILAFSLIYFVAIFLCAIWFGS